MTISLTSSDQTEGTVSPTSLIFTASDWNVKKTVTITGVDDDSDDGNIAYTILTAPAVSDDINYNVLNADDIEVTNHDNDDGSGEEEKEEDDSSNGCFIKTIRLI